MTLGRPLEFDPEIALKSAMDLFWCEGYKSSSLQNLISVMKLSKSSFYQTFKSKQALFQLCLQYYREVLVEQLSLELIESRSGKVFIRSVFENIANETDKTTPPKGCLLMNTANEFSQTDTEIARLVSSSIQSITSVFELAVKQSQSNGEIPGVQNPGQLASYLVNSICGLRNMIKAGAERTQVDQIVELTLSILD